MRLREETISSKNTEINKEYYYSLGRRYLSFVGLWPYQTPMEKLRNFAIFLTLAMTLIIPVAAQFLNCKADLECIIESLPISMLAVVGLVKIFTYFINSNQMKDLTDHLFADWNTLQEEEYEILAKYAGNGRRYSYLYTIFVYGGIAVFALTSLVPRILDVVLPLNTSRPIMMICPVDYFVDQEKYFYYIFFHMLIVAELCFTAVLAHDCMYFIYIEHVCGLFAVVGFRFECWLYRYNAKESPIDCSGNTYCRKIAFSIITHLKALEFAALLENAFTISFGVQMLFATVGMSVTLVLVSMQLKNNKMLEICKYMVFIFAQLLHLFFLSFGGQQLIDHSLEIHEKIYSGMWYNLPVKPQKLLLFALKKSAEASYLSAGKIFIFCREGFTTVLQTSMSYFTVLSTVNE